MEASDGPLALPTAAFDASSCLELAAQLTAAAAEAPSALPGRVPAAYALGLLRRVERLLKAEPTVVQVHPPAGAEVVVAGDLHGQFHDLLTIFAQVGYPDAGRLYVFDGDFVDRGCWGLEIVLLLAALKAAAPRGVCLVRGNHESKYCSWVYGFRAEVMVKYGATDAKQGELGAEGGLGRRSGKADSVLRCRPGTLAPSFPAAARAAQMLPLAAVVAGNTLVLHGGLPRAPPRRATRRSLPEDELTLALLADIAAASKGGDDPEPDSREQRLAVDVLWSDPCAQPGVTAGARPGDVGVLFGPDATEAFLRDNGLSLVLRGHEGPDARTLRPDMPSIDGGWSLDHDTPCGRLYTVFSAPDYPQFGQPRYGNLGAVAVLAGPRYDEPRFVQFEAAARPPAQSFMPTEETEADLEAAEECLGGSRFGDMSGKPANGPEQQLAAAVAASRMTRRMAAGRQQRRRQQARQQHR
ncbi:serine threonine-phosphatase 7 [Micractinium conductrix]|uniref:Serine/threonine-protein phosphatase n=1 Tax=Micractinium conductrix TaxID=554055 RepID=A0A2P6VEW9_9CHLO|nr:serine threonine-phosphatase 7 [Micractinium conductrix]|eukprot:PSC72636.1 serine threonine-phosphatase 7 [Micractinium conductrix]